MHTGLRDLYGLSVLRFYKDFCEFLDAAEYKHKTNGFSHPFIQKVEESLSQAFGSVRRRPPNEGELEGIFQDWQDRVQRGFKRRNFYGMLLKEVPEMMVDARSILKQMDLLTTWSIHVTTAVGQFEDRLARIESAQQATSPINQPP